MLNYSYFYLIYSFGGSVIILPIGTCGLLRGVVRELVCFVRLGEGISWSNPLVQSKSESIYPTLDYIPNECAKLERVVKLVDYPEGTGPSEP